MEKTCLIGHKGFVGSNLALQASFTHCFNSKNIGEMAGQSFDLVVCAGVSGVKWQANADPAGDWAQIQKLIDVLATIKAKQFVLISTIDVYPPTLKGADEEASLVGLEKIPYGENRLRLEQWVSERFEDHFIFRLPALFGANLRKNVLFDLMHSNGLEKINPAGILQWYPLGRLWQDISRARTGQARLVNLVTAPLSIKALLERTFPESVVGPEVHPSFHYDFHTRHAALLGGQEGYLLSAEQVQDEIAAFVKVAR
jgi:hypothetical protein